MLNKKTLENLIVTKERERGKEIVEEIRNILEKRRAKLKGRAKTKIRFSEKQGKEPNFIEANAEFVDGVLTEEDRKKIDELLKKIAEENQ